MTVRLSLVYYTATMIGLVITGQLLAAIALDHFGWVGFAVHPLSLGRIMGVILLIIGIALIQKT